MQDKLEFGEIEKIKDTELLEISKDVTESIFSKEPEQEKTIVSKEKKQRVTKEKKVFESVSNDDDDLFTKSETETTKVKLNDLIQSNILIEMFDKLMTLILPLGLNAVGMKIKPSDIAATREEKKTLEPVLFAATKTINLDFSNPWVSLAVTAVVIYGTKAAGKINFGELENETESNNNDKPHYSDKKAYSKWYREQKKR